ncbi:epoxide hydrolase 2-like [Cicer arietinum]|uniref:epoxide hydrolase 2-like n=1 Tax=Cicer arietinum TaxID=3827 RepID=UPI003CC66014
MLTSRRTGPPILPKEGMGSNLDPSSPHPLPSWLSQEDLSYYASKFDKSGFTGPLNYYRNLNLNWELTTAWTGAKVKVHVKFITGDLDLVYNSLGTKQYIESSGFKRDVPNLEEVVIQEGVVHFNNQEAAEDITNHIYEFIKKF